MGPAARRGTAGAVTCTVLMALPVLVLLPVLVSLLGVSSGPRFDLVPVAVGILWLALAALPVLAWSRQSWRLAVPALVIAVAGVGYGLLMYLGGLELARQDCRQLFCDVGMYIGPAVAAYSFGVVVTLALLIRTLRRVPAVSDLRV